MALKTVSTDSMLKGELIFEHDDVIHIMNEEALNFQVQPLTTFEVLVRRPDGGEVVLNRILGIGDKLVIRFSAKTSTHDETPLAGAEIIAITQPPTS